jgi:uracil-DNA glycosylase
MPARSSEEPTKQCRQAQSCASWSQRAATQLTRASPEPHKPWRRPAVIGNLPYQARICFVTNPPGPAEIDAVIPRFFRCYMAVAKL